MKNYVKIINIIDKSGSMGSMIDTAINGFNEFLIEQKKVEGKAVVSTVLFNSQYQPLYEDLDIQNCQFLDKNNYVPSSMTALYDSICKTISIEIDKLGNLPIEERPDKTICVILTDGQENSSKIYNRETTKNMITEMKEDFKWEFIFLCADEEAATTAETIGISRGNSYAFVNNAGGIRDAYAGVSYASTNYRKSKSVKMENLMDEYKSTKKDEKSK